MKHYKYQIVKVVTAQLAAQSQNLRQLCSRLLFKHVCGNKTGYFKPKYDLLLNLNRCFLCLNLTDDATKNWNVKFRKVSTYNRTTTYHCRNAHWQHLFCRLGCNTGNWNVLNCLLLKRLCIIPVLININSTIAFKTSYLCVHPNRTLHVNFCKSCLILLQLFGLSLLL